MVDYYQISFILLIHYTYVAGSAALAANTSESCQEMNSLALDVYLGFPMLVQFSFPMKMLLEQKKYTCNVIDLDSNMVLSTSNDPLVTNVYADVIVYRVDNVTIDLPKSYKILCQNQDSNNTTNSSESFCAYDNVNVTLQNKLTSNCSGDPIQTSPFSMTHKSVHRLHCIAPESLENDGNVSYQWWEYKNGSCFEELDNNTRLGSENELQFTSANFDNPGAYICVATYKASKIVVKRFDVCVKYREIVSDNKDLQCTAVPAPLGSDATITCNIVVSKGKSNPGRYFWYKGEDTDEICNYEVRDGEGSGKGKYVCNETESYEEDECYISTPTEEPQDDLRTITLTIKKLNEHDFGLYRLKFHIRGQRDISWVNITLQQDTKKLLKADITAISLGVVALLIVSVSIVAGVVWRSDVQWFYKMYFGPFEQGNYSYVAHFLYHYDAEKEDAEEMKNTKCLVNKMHDFMDKFGGTVYDIQKDPSLSQYDANNIQAILNDCYRTILFLSPSFVLDHWSRYAAYEAMEAVIKDGKKILFINMPGTEKAMKGMEKEPRTTLRMAMKSNTTVKWNGKVPFSGTFVRRLEYFLPKFQKPYFARFLSDSSQAQLTQYNSTTAFQSEALKTKYKSGCENRGVL